MKRPSTADLWATYAALERKARSEPFRFADAEAARRAYRAFVEADGYLPGVRPGVLPGPMPARAI